VLDFKNWCQNRSYTETGYHVLLHEAQAQNPGARTGDLIWNDTTWAQAAINRQSSKTDLVNSVAHEMGHAGVDGDLDEVSELLEGDSGLHELGIIERRDYYREIIGYESPMGTPGPAGKGQCDETTDQDTYRKLYSECTKRAFEITRTA